MSEYQIQAAFVQMIQGQYPDVLFSATVGGIRLSIGAAMKMKKAGYVRGVPDLVFFEPRRGYCGLCIEVKKKGGRPSKQQKQWKADLRERGYRSVVCTGLKECVMEFNHYFTAQLPQSPSEG